MSLNSSKIWMASSFLAVIVVMGAGMARSSTAQAQFRPPYRPYGRDRDDRYNRAYQIAFQRGYQTGLDRGRDDARDHRRANPANSSHYRDGDSGYRSEYGRIEEYREGYRAGFRRGYYEAYRRYSHYRGR